jgi:uncharacterized oxidoreductase
VELEDRRVLITGGGSGIGRALAERLAGAGSNVVIAGRNARTLDNAREAAPRLRALRLDVTSESDAVNALAWIERELGGLDLLVNSAGVMHGGGLDAAEAPQTTTEELEVNLGGAIRMTRLALPLLAASRQPGVVFISSAVALTAVPGFAVYAATKAALHSLARSVRQELASEGIRVFEVLPPVVDTALAGDLQVAKMPAAAVAEAVIKGLRRDREQIAVGQIRQLVLLARIAPRLADHIVLRALGMRPG